MRAKGERRMPPPCRPVSIHFGALAALLDPPLPPPPLRKAALVAPGRLWPADRQGKIVEGQAK
jgi:hypothetical protein